MSYEKRLCILKQIKRGFSAGGGEISGAIYAERLSQTLILTPKITDIAPLKEGRYALAVWVDKEGFCLPLNEYGTVKKEGDFSLKEGFAVLLCFLKSGLTPEPVAFGSCGNAPSSYEALLPLLEEQKPLPSTSIPIPYEDEAISETNYYEEGIEEPVKWTRGGLTYYYKIKEKLQKLMKEGEKWQELEQIFPHSQWVKTNSAYLGILFKEGTPKYLCLARKKGEEIPENMKEHALFVPSLFEENGGYEVVFQDAETGEYVSVGQA